MPLSLKTAHLSSILIFLRALKLLKLTVKVEFAEHVQHNQQYYKVRWIITDTVGNDGELFVINSFDV